MQAATFVNPKVKLDDSEPGNRKVICIKNIEEGEIILEEQPQIFAIYSNNFAMTCHYCLVELEHPKRCSVCKYSHYCSTDHQTLDWKKAHKKECPIIRDLTQQGKRIPTAPLMLALKAFVQLEYFKNKDLLENLNSLKNHQDKMSAENYEEYKNNIIMIIKCSDQNFDLERIERYIQYQDKMMVNGGTTYSKTDPSNSLAMTLLKDFCRVNHSCEPNCFLVFNPERGDRLVAARAINAGEEITTSYVNTLDRLEVRKKKLREEYFFECSCPKCKREEADSNFSRSRILSKEVVNESLNSLDQVKNFLSRMASKLGEYDYEWYDVLENVEQTLIKLNELKFLYNFRKSFTKKFEHWFKGIMMNPTVCQHYNHLAKLSNYLGFPQENYEYCKEALKISKKYFTGPENDQLELMLRDVKAFLELQNKRSLK